MLDDLHIQRYAIPFKIPGSQWERQVLHYFCVRGAKDLSGWTSSDFYHRTVLQMSQNEVVVRNALLALGSFHLDLARQRVGEKDETAIVPSTRSLAQYNKAVRQLRRYIARRECPSRAIVMMCCALFYSVENICGNYNAATEHLQGGLQILQGCSNQGPVRKASDDPEQPSEIVGSLAEEFVRMDFQASVFQNSRLPTLLPQDHLPMVFHSLDQAQITLDNLKHRLLRFLIKNEDLRNIPGEDLPQPVVQEKLHLLRQYQLWFDTLENLEVQNGIEGHLISAALELHYRYTRIYLLSSFPEDGSFFSDESGKKEAERILELAEKLSEDGRNKAPTAPSFCSEMGVVVPLATMALRTFDTAIGERAILLLDACGRREGPLDSRMLVKVVKKINTLRVERKASSTVVRRFRVADSSTSMEVGDKELPQDPMHVAAFDIVARNGKQRGPLNVY